MHYYITPYEIVGEVAALTGVEVRLVYGPPNRGYSIGKREDGLFYLTVPSGLTYINAQVRGSILHEALHILYSDILHNGNLKDEIEKLGYKEEEFEVAHRFLNAFEDVRIQLKGEQELAGARYIFREAYKFTEMTLVERLYSLIYHKMDPNDNNRTIDDNEQKSWMSHAYLGLSIGMTGGYSPYSKQIDFSGPYPAGYSNSIIAKLDDPWRNEVFRTVRQEMEEDPDFDKDKLEPIGNASKVTWEAVDQAMGYFGRKLRDTPTTLEGYAYAAKHFLPAYRNLLPDNLKQTFDENRKMQELISKMLELMKQLAKEAGASGQGANGSGNALLRALCKDKDEEKQLDDMLKSNGYSKWSKLKEKEMDGRIVKINAIGDSIKDTLAPILQEIKEWQETGTERTRLKRGKIDGRQLHRVAVDENDVFRKDVDPEYTDDVAFSVVVDTSGSMFEDCDDEEDDMTSDKSPVVVGFGIGAGLNKALLQIDKACTLISFSNDAFLAVDNGRRCDTEAITKGMENSGGGTNLHAGVKMAVECLDRREEKSKIMFVISDGDVGGGASREAIDKCHEHGIIPYFVYINVNVEEGDGNGAFGSRLQDNARTCGRKDKKGKVYTSATNPKHPDYFVKHLTDFVKGMLEGNPA
jgi:hypothetical protein